MLETTYRWTVTSEPRADFTAMVSLSTRDTGEPPPTRVRLSDEELVNDPNRIDCIVSDCVEKSKGTKQCDILRTRIPKAVR
jgi:hypothetical protein